MRAVALLVVALAGAGCASTHVSPARFVSRSPAGGVVATPRADVGMDDANTMIAAHCGAGGFAISREGEALVGDTVLSEGARSVDAQTTDGAGQIQGHDTARTVHATGSDWQVHYACNDPRTVNMGLITRSRTAPSKLAWGADVGAGMMTLAGNDLPGQYPDDLPRDGATTALAANGWIGAKLSDRFVLGGGVGVTQVVAMPQWDYGNPMNQTEADATALELFATVTYGLAPRLDLRVRIGMAEWRNVSVDGIAPLAFAQLGYRVVDVGPGSGVYVGASVGSYFSSSLTSNVLPALVIGFH